MADDGQDGRQDTRRVNRSRGRRALRIGSFAGVPIEVNATWFIVAAVITVAFAPFVRDQVPEVGDYVYVVTAAFAVLLYASVLLHELSHAVVGRALGLKVKGITLHLLGGYTEMEGDSPTPGREAAVSGVGPLVSVATGGVAYLLSLPVDQTVVDFLLLELAVANLFVGVFNLLPGLPLDGGHVLRAIVWKATGSQARGTIVAGWCGRVLAFLVVLLPFAVSGGDPSLFGVVWGLLLGFFLWGGANASMAGARLRERLPRLQASTLARPAVTVQQDVSLAEAVRRAQEIGARAIVVVDSGGQPVAIVNEASVVATPEQRRPWLTAGQVARSIEPGMVIRDDQVGEPLLRALQAKPTTEYLVLDADGSVRGVLATADVNAALTTA